MEQATQQEVAVGPELIRDMSELEHYVLSLEEFSEDQCGAGKVVDQSLAGGTEYLVPLKGKKSRKKINRGGGKKKSTVLTKVQKGGGRKKGKKSTKKCKKGKKGRK